MAAQAFVTCAFDDSSAFGCMVLAYSVRKHRSTRRLVVLVTQHVSHSVRLLLSEIFDNVVPVPPLDFSKWTVPIQREMGKTFVKIHVWKLVQFQKCVFLDADTLMLDNCDELFDREEFSAVPDIGWPDCFNSGVFVFSPSLATYEALISMEESGASFDGTDQGLLNSYFHGWRGDIRYRLPFIYNMVTNVSYSYAPAFQRFGTQARIAHFVEHIKPWDVHWDTHASSHHHHGPGGIFFPEWLQTFQLYVLPKLPESARAFLATRKFASIASLANHFNYTESSVSSWHPEPVKSIHPDPLPTTVFAAANLVPKTPPSTPPSTPLTTWQPPTLEVWDHPIAQEREPEIAPSLSQSWNVEVSVRPKSPPPAEILPYHHNSPERSPQSVQTILEDSYRPTLDVYSNHDKVVESRDAVVAQEVSVQQSDPEVSSASSPRECTEDKEEVDEELERMLAWEQGTMDYLGKDSFENVLRRLEASMMGAEASEPVVDTVDNPEPPDSVSSKEEDNLTMCLQELAVDGEDSASSVNVQPSGYQVGDFTGMTEWEQGRYDIQGRDSSDSIMRRLEFFLDDTQPKDPEDQV